MEIEKDSLEDNIISIVLFVVTITFLMPLISFVQFIKECIRWIKKRGVYFQPSSREYISHEKTLATLLLIYFFLFLVLPISLSIICSTSIDPVGQLIKVPSLIVFPALWVYILSLALIIKAKANKTVNTEKPEEANKVSKSTSASTSAVSKNNLTLVQLPFGLENPKRQSRRFNMEIDGGDKIFKVSGTIDNIKIISKN